MFACRSTPASIAAAEALAAGLSVIPIRLDRTKQPLGAWKEYQLRQPTEAELYAWFEYASYGMAVVTGTGSGHLMCIDCDSKAVADEFATHLDTAAPGLLARLVIVESPRGRHYYYRSATGSSPNAVLAADPSTKKTRIDFKGEGGLVIAPPSCGNVHPTGLPYFFATDRSFAHLPVLLQAEEVEVLMAAKRCDLRPQPGPTRTSRPPVVAVTLVRRAACRTSGGRPGDRFEQTVDWAEVLEPYGWTLASEAAGGVRHWTRPGKDCGTSATTGYDPDGAGRDLLYVFSASAPPFEPERGYSKFSAHALLAHGGDFRAAARAVASHGVYIPRSLLGRLARGPR